MLAAGLFWGCAPVEQQAALAPASQELTPTEPEKVKEELTTPEPEATASLEVKELAALGEWEEGTQVPPTPEEKVTFDFPITMNKQVEFYLDFFQTKQRDTFARWLSRSSKYLPMVKRKLKEAGLPLDLCYLPVIESGYSLTAYSRARATGPWQFMRATGKNYGLTINEYVDERRDPVRSTEAAIAYLSNLYEEFGCWQLAVAGYNAGEGKIRRAIKRYKTNNFWEIAKGRYLRLETKRYVPKLIAAILIAKEPEKYGFTNIEPQEPLEYEVVNVPRWTSLRAVAMSCNVDFEEMRNLNRQLRRTITPPYAATYPIKVPPGKTTLVAENLPKIRPIITTRYREHKVKHGETLTRICKKYNLNKTTLLKANNLKYERLSLGQRLRIPFQTTSFKMLTPTELAKKGGPASIAPENLVLHKVQPGETLSIISRQYSVPMHMIAAWNDLPDLRYIRAGQQLALYLQGANTNKATVASVQPSKQSSQSQAKKRPAAPQRLTASAKSRPDTTKLTYYRVRRGDNLWTISKKFQLTPAKIMRWNQMDDDVIYPGRRLLLKIAQDIDT